jgi:hypothetical protein
VWEGEKRKNAVLLKSFTLYPLPFPLSPKA